MVKPIYVKSQFSKTLISMVVVEPLMGGQEPDVQIIGTGPKGGHWGCLWLPLSEFKEAVASLERSPTDD